MTPTPPTPTEVAELRRRAGALRRLARSLDQSVIRDVAGLAGDDTWRGPTADAFLVDARRAAADLDDAVALVHRAAVALDTAADHAERAQLPPLLR